MTTIHYSLPPVLADAVTTALNTWQDKDNTARLWARDASLWSGSDEAQWLDWLDIVQEQQAGLAALQDTVRSIVDAGFQYLVLLGMGGSSLCPDVLRETFGHVEGHPELLVLDSTDPAAVTTLTAISAAISALRARNRSPSEATMPRPAGVAGSGNTGSVPATSASSRAIRAASAKARWPSSSRI